MAGHGVISEMTSLLCQLDDGLILFGHVDKVFDLGIEDMWFESHHGNQIFYASCIGNQHGIVYVHIKFEQYVSVS